MYVRMHAGMHMMIAMIYNGGKGENTTLLVCLVMHEALCALYRVSVLVSYVLRTLADINHPM